MKVLCPLGKDVQKSTGAAGRSDLTLDNESRDRLSHRGAFGHGIRDVRFLVVVGAAHACHSGAPSGQVEMTLQCVSSKARVRAL